MERNPRIARWSGAILGISVALLLNVALARAADDVVTEEFHHTYPLSASGRIELQNINGAVHIAVWDQNEVKVDAVKRADIRRALERRRDSCRGSSGFYFDRDPLSRTGRRMAWRRTTTPRRLSTR